MHTAQSWMGWTRPSSRAATREIAPMRGSKKAWRAVLIHLAANDVIGRHRNIVKATGASSSEMRTKTREARTLNTKSPMTMPSTSWNSSRSIPAMSPPMRYLPSVTGSNRLHQIPPGALVVALSIAATMAL